MAPRGCQKCGGTGYQGRFLLVEMLTLSRTELAHAVLARSETALIERLAAEAGMFSRWQRACRAVEEGLTSPAEVRRALGFRGVQANSHPRLRRGRGGRRGEFRKTDGFVNKTSGNSALTF